MRLVKWVLAALLLWSLYWTAAAWGVRQGITGWFADRASQGWQAEFAGMETAGYPLRHELRLLNPALADPGTGAAWQAEWLQLDSPAIWPGYQRLRFPATPQRLSYFDQTVEIAADGLTASLRLAPGAALTLEEMALEAAEWEIRQHGTVVLGGSALQAGMAQTETQDTYRITVEAADFAPRAAWRRRLAAASDLPPAFDTLALDMDVTFDTPWDRAALEQRRPQPREIALKLADARWGELRIKATGTLTVDGTGLPEGSLALQAEEWRGLLAMAERAGSLPPAMRTPLERVLSLFAGTGGNPETLDITLNFADGMTRLGPLPLGPAPRIILR
ncbi:DUF2125 domain-containing protein [Cribrihabitans neustonicus]|uniref:DUF2125 domain-containing protein n=1 Tax=Cribrihabitans neustonicus TaxID=1429085 RepID=UPI003B5C4C7D